MNNTIIVVGAGASGLMAARHLSDRKFDVVLLEARDEAGGRIQTHCLPDGSGVVEAGAEFIHGRLPITLELCKEAGIKYIPVEGKMYRKEKNEWTEQDQIVEGWDALIQKMRSVDNDMTMAEFLDKYYSGDRYIDLRIHIISYIEGFDLADPKRASVKAIYREWSHEEGENFRIVGGYKRLIDYLEQKCVEQGCIIAKDDAVRQIDWQQNEATAYTQSGKKYSADKIIVTVPVSVLTSVAGSCAINFTPPIDDHIRAAADIGFGTVIKIVIQFNIIHWKDDTGFIFSEEAIPTWWTQLPDNNNTLTGWAGGSRASNLCQHTESELLDIAVTSLSRIFNKNVEQIKSSIRHAYVFNWQNHSEALGAYSYATPATPDARELFDRPLSNTIFFAGECFYNGDFPGTVEAALTSGIHVAKQVVDLHRL